MTDRRYVVFEGDGLTDANIHNKVNSKKIATDMAQAIATYHKRDIYVRDTSSGKVLRFRARDKHPNARWSFPRKQTSLRVHPDDIPKVHAFAEQLNQTREKSG